jgi:hypothetical protein
MAERRGIDICPHLRPVLDYIVEQGIEVHYVGTPWSRNCRTWVYFTGVVLDPVALIARFNLPDVVRAHVHRGTHDGAEQGIECTEHHDALMGGHPDVVHGYRTIT